MYVVVIGGGNVGYYLTKELLAAGHEVVVIEEDPARARQIADELGSIVIANDGCEGRYQAEAGMARADVVAAVTGDDAVNLAASQVAKKRPAVPRCESDAEVLCGGPVEAAVSQELPGGLGLGRGQLLGVVVGRLLEGAIILFRAHEGRHAGQRQADEQQRTPAIAKHITAHGAFLARKS